LYRFCTLIITLHMAPFAIRQALFDILLSGA
jgi:hypothetical protein